MDWRLIFNINVPIGVLGALAALAVFPRFHPTNWPNIAYGLFTLLLAFTKGEDWGWTGYRVGMLLVSAALDVASFVVIELEVDHPLIDIRVFRSWPFVNALLLITVDSRGMFATLYYFPRFLQNAQGGQGGQGRGGLDTSTRTEADRGPPQPGSRACRAGVRL